MQNRIVVDMNNNQRLLYEYRKNPFGQIVLFF